MTDARVGIIVGSTSDLEIMKACTEQLERFEVPTELTVASAHRNPERVHEWATTARRRGLQVIIAAAGKAAHLAGAVAAYTSLPVVAVPIKTSDLGGLDSLLSTVQMPSGVPVACVAINGAKNAAILATQIIAAGDPALVQVLEDFKRELAQG
ncbi:MAG: 5-(carboxyamino)imidazole ribonucleotide mutase [Coriobacteriales bacterium]|jgi:5-(carboxyamino)imidazole ribonucleotide mutase|nr:5-(carboxyamino)imidazole ribonucleotide mutase [Coriobacteriales bacterium]